MMEGTSISNEIAEKNCATTLGRYNNCCVSSHQSENKHDKSIEWEGPNPKEARVWLKTLRVQTQTLFSEQLENHWQWNIWKKIELLEFHSKVLSACKVIISSSPYALTKYSWRWHNTPKWLMTKGNMVTKTDWRIQWLHVAQIWTTHNQNLVGKYKKNSQRITIALETSCIFRANCCKMANSQLLQLRQ